MRGARGDGAFWRIIAVAALSVSTAAVGLSVPAGPAGAATVAPAAGSAAQPNVTKPPALVQGGALKCGPVSTTHGSPVIDAVFTLTMATGTSGSQTVNPTTDELPDTTPPTALPSGSHCQVTGVIPSGWSITVEGLPLTLSGAGNAGTLAAGAWHDTFTQTCYGTAVTGTSFTNQGTFTSTPGTHCAAGNVTANIVTFTNTGTVTGSTKGGWIFTHHSTTTNGTFTNFGDLAVPAGSTISFGGGGNACKFGTIVVLETGGTVDNQGTLSVDCGGLTVNGGTITDGSSAGSVTLSPEPAGETLRFGTTSPAHAEGTIKLSGSGTTLAGTILSGYTVDQPNGNLPFTGSAGNDGTLILGGFSTLSGTGTFTNAGTITVANSYSISVPTFVNKGGIDVGFNDTLDFVYDSTTVAGALDNTGTFTVASGGHVTIGTENCKSGETLVLGKGSTVKTPGTFDVQCGGLKLAGGSVSTAGPLDVAPIGAVTVTFAQSTGTGTGGSTDTISVTRTGASLVGLVPKGWTLESDVAVTALTKAGNEAGNEGVFDLTSGGKLVDSQNFYNYGTFEASASVSVTAHSFFSSGTVSALANSDLQFVTDGGSFTARGPIDVAAKGAITLGSENCTTGVTLVLTTGSSLSNAGTFDLQCGKVQLAGGTISSTGPLTVHPISKATVDFTGKAPAGTGGTADTISVTGGGATVEGTIPTGWTVRADVPVTAAAATVNDGNVVLLPGGSVTDAGALSNAGTLETDGSVKVSSPVFTNAADGSVLALNGGNLSFSYDNATAPGTVTNDGSMTVATGGKITVGPESCKQGETLITKAGSTIAATGTFVMTCGELTVRGGTVTSAGPIELTSESLMSVHFATGLPAGAGGAEDTLKPTADGVVFDNSIPAGWTLDDATGRTLVFSPGAGNNGTLTAGDFGHLDDTSGFVNSGTMTVSGPFSLTKTVPTFTNTGSLTLDTRQGFTGRETIFDNTGTLTIDSGATLEFDGYTQTAKGTLNLAIHGTSYGRVYSDAAATLNGTLNLTTTTVAAVGSRLNIVHWSTSEKGNFSKLNGDVVNSTTAYGVQYCTGAVTTFCADSLQLRVVNSVVSQSLKASNVSTPTPSSVNPGKTFTVSYKVTNTGESTDPGGWEDSVYVGTGTTYQSGDTLLTRIPHDTTLAPGVSYTNTVTVKAPDVSPSSNYHVIVVPDSASLVAGATFANQAASKAFTIGSIVLLKPGTPVTATLAAGENLYYRVTVSTTDVGVKVTTPGGGDADLYAAHDTVPTTSTFAAASSQGAATPSVTLTKSTGGTWFLLVHGDDAAGSGVHITVEATDVGMTVSSVTPSTIASSQYPGNDATLTVRGSGFTGSSALALVFDSNPTLQATSFDYTVVNSTLAYVTVTTRMAQGAYTVVVTTGSSKATLPGGLTVTAPHTGGGLKITVSGGSGLRFGWAGSVTATFTNTSSADIDVPIVTFSAKNGLVALPGSTTFQPDITTLIPDFSSPRGPKYPPGILPPGATGTLSFAVLSTTRTTGSPITAQVNDINSTERTVVKWTTLITGFAGQGGFGLSCATLTPLLHTCAERTFISSDINFALGGTDGELARNVPRMLATAKSNGVTITNESQLFAYVIQQQIDSGAGAPVSGNIHLTGGSPIGQSAVVLTSTKGGQVYTGTSWYDGQFSVWTVPPGTYTLTVPGYIPRPALTRVHVETAFEVIEHHGTPSQNLSITLHPGATVKGTITDATTSAPVAGAVVTVRDVAGSVTSGVTGTDGTYSVQGVEPGPVEVTAAAPGFISSTTVSLTETTGETTTRNFSLSQGGTIAGSVRGLGGGSAPTGVTVLAVAPTGTEPAGTGMVELGGAFSISGLKAGTYDVVARGPGGLVAQAAGLSVTVGSTTSAGTLTLINGGTVKGNVTDAATGDPVAGVAVDVRGAPAQGTSVTTTAGTFTITGVAPGTQIVGFAPPGGSGLNPASVKAAVTSGGLSTVNEALTPFGSMSVKVTTGGGTTPVAGVRVTITGSFGLTTVPTAVKTRNLFTGPTGTGAVTTVLPGTYRVAVTGTTTTSVVTVGPGNNAPTVSLDVPLATVAGTVRSGTGSPLSGVTVSALSGGDAVATTTTNGTGNYTLQLTTSGTVTVVAAGNGFAPRSAVVSVAVGTTTTVGFTGGTSSLTVSVASGGTAVATAQVSLATPTAPGEFVTATTSTSGHAAFTGVPLGTFKLSVTAGNYAQASRTVDVSAGSNTVMVTVAKGGAIAGKVTGPTGPLVGVPVRASDGMAAGSAVTGTTGQYSIDSLAAGTYTVSFTDALGQGSAPAQIGGVSVSAGGSTNTVDATLVTTGSLLHLVEPASPTGGYPPLVAQVIDSNGSQVERATLGPGEGATSTTTSASVGPLAAGTYTLVVTGPGRGTTTTPVTMPMATPLTVTVPPAAGPVTKTGPGQGALSAAAPAAHAAPAAVQGRARSAARRPGGRHRTVPAAARRRSSHPVPAAAGRRTSEAAPAAAGRRTSEAAPAAAGPNAAPTTVATPTPAKIGGLTLLFAITTKVPVPARANNDNTVLANQVQSALARTIPTCATPSAINALKDRLRRAVSAKEQSYLAWTAAYKAYFQVKWNSLWITIFDILAVIKTAMSIFASLTSGIGVVENAALKLGFSTTKLSTAFSAFNSAAINALTTSALVNSVTATPTTPYAFTHTATTVAYEAGILLNALSVLALGLPPFSAALAVVGTIIEGVVEIRQLVKQFNQFLPQLAGMIQPIVVGRNTYNKAVVNVIKVLRQLGTAYLNLKKQKDCPKTTPPKTPHTPPATQTPGFKNNSGFDPNGLTGPPGFSTPRWVAPTSPLSYVVHFQNEHTAAIAVSQVTVVEPLPTRVEPTSVSLTGFGFGVGTVHVVLPAGQASFTKVIPHGAPNGDDVQVIGTYDAEANAITWVFTAINPKTGDVDSAVTAGFLPPDTTAGKGEGYVSFTAKMRPGTTTGTGLSTKATIIFDRNPAIATTTWTNAVDANTPTAAVTPLPATSKAGTLTVKWSGSDGNGSGVRSYNVYVSVTGGALTPWQTKTAARSAIYKTTAGHTYGFAAQAVNNVGTEGTTPTNAQTTTSATASTTSTPTTPGKPGKPSATAGDASAKVSWAAPTTDGGSTITGYTVTSTPTAKTCATAGARTCTVTGLTNGRAYTFTVKAKNTVGTSAPSTKSSPVTPATTPGKPGKPSATAGNASAKVSWAAPSTDGGSTITGYTATSTPTAKTCATTGTDTCTVTGLTNGRAYTFTVKAKNTVGTSQSSTKSSPVTPATTPGKPGKPSATAGNGSAKVSWAAPTTDGGSTITGYTVTSTSTAKTCATAGARTCTVTGLTNGRAYTFTVKAKNTVGTSQPSTKSSPVTPATTPGKPGKPSATAGNASAKVSWAAPTTDGGSTITGYTVTSTSTAKTCATAGARTCTVTGLTNGRAYTFTVKAKNTVGTSQPSTKSSPVTPATTPGKPGKPSATAGNASAKVSWAAPTTDGGSTITGYTVTSTSTAKTCATAGARTCTVTGLTNGRAYTFTVKAKNTVGTGPTSMPSAAVIPSGPPGPTITSLSRTSGPVTGGNNVTITGTRFATVRHVKFGTATATFTVKSTTSLQATTPAHAAGTVRVSVVTAVGTTPTTSADLYNFTIPVPAVSGLSPASGSPSGGTTVTVSGSWLTAATTVYFGSTAGRTISVNPGGTQLTVKSPAGAAGTSVNVRAMTPGGESPAVTADLFTYGPTITSLSRTSGSGAGGTKVTITGTGFSTVEHVKFGTTTATFTVKSTTSLQVTSPAHAAGTVRVSVVTAVGTTPTTPDDTYHYLN